MRTGGPGVILAVAAALALSACGSSATQSATHAALATTSSGTSSTTTSTTSTAANAHKKHKKTHKTTTTSTTTSKTTKSKKTTSSTTTTTHSTTSKTTTTAALKGPLQAMLVGENHHPKIKTLWSYTVTATDAHGRKLSGTIETEFAYGGSVVGKESPFKHQFTNGAITNQVTYPARSLGAKIDIQVIVITSIGTKTLDWAVSSVK